LSLTIAGGQITVGMLTFAPNDPLCCPSQEAEVVYALHGDQLLQVSG
jgi:hypothetical protein